MADYTVKSGNLEPAVNVILRDSAGVPVDLTDADGVTFRFSEKGSTAGLFDRAATIDSPPTAGSVTYNWQAGDTADAGKFQGEFTVSWPTARPQTYPASGYVSIKITPRLPEP